MTMRTVTVARVVAPLSVIMCVLDEDAKRTDNDDEDDKCPDTVD